MSSCSSNDVINICSKMVISGSTSDCGKSLSYICGKYKVPRDITVMYEKRIVYQSYRPVETDVIYASLIRDLLEMRFQKTISDQIFNHDEINFILTELCTV